MRSLFTFFGVLCSCILCNFAFADGMKVDNSLDHPAVKYQEEQLLYDRMNVTDEQINKIENSEVKEAVKQDRRDANTEYMLKQLPNRVQDMNDAQRDNKK